MLNFLECMRTGKDPVCPVEVGHRANTLCVLTHIAMKLGRKLSWDPISEAFIQDDEANRLLDYPHREPWTAGNADRPVGVAGWAAWWPKTHDFVANYPYGYTLWCQWQAGGEKKVIPAAIYPDWVATGNYTVAPWVNATWYT